MSKIIIAPFRTYVKNILCFNLHPAGKPKHDPLLGVNRHAVHQPSPKASVEFSDELLQVLHGIDEALELPATDHDLVDLLDDRIALSLGILVPADQRVVALVVFFLVLRHPCIPSDQVRDGLGVDAQLLIQNPALLLQRRGVCQPILDGGELRDIKLPVGIELVRHPDERGLHLILGQVRRRAAGLVFELMIALPDDPAVLVATVPDLRAVPSAAAAAPDLPREDRSPAVLGITSAY